MNANDFDLVTFEQDRNRAFDDLGRSSSLVTAWTSGGRPVFFQVGNVLPDGIRLTVVEGDVMSAQVGEDVEVLFSLDDGQYHWRTRLQGVAPDGWLLERSETLSRLQRRNNFRTSVPRGYKAHLLLKTLKTHVITPTPLVLVDISAGGARVQWPASGLSPIVSGETLSGTLAVPGQRTIEVFGIAKSVLTDVDTGRVEVGLEFQNVSGRDEQSLLHLCLQIRRFSSPVLK